MIYNSIRAFASSSRELSFFAKKYILNQINGQPQGLSLRYDISFNLLTAVSYHIFVNFHGGSKPPLYAERGNLRRLKGIKNGYFVKVPVK